MASKITIISDDQKLIEHIKTTALTLTKLNKTIFITDISVKNLTKPENDIPINTKYVLIDLDDNFNLIIDYIKKIRNTSSHCSVKIISFFSESSPPDKKAVFNSGCDAVFSKEELIAVVQNLLQY